MKESIYKKDMNHVEITGEIHNLPEYVRYVPRPLISFDVNCYRKRRNVEDEYKFDELKVVIFDDETFLKEAKEGDRFHFIGELQSRNYNRVNEEMDEMYTFAVQNYFTFKNEYPTENQPIGKKKEVIQWSKLMELGLIPEVPDDSMYDEFMNKEKTQETPFIYRVDENGEVTKETQHVTYEILVKKYEKIEEILDPLEGDVNRVKMAGRVTRNPFFNFLGQTKPVAFVNFNIGMKSEVFPEHMFFPHAIAWGKTAEDIFSEVHEEDYVMFKGRLQSRNYVKKFVKRWVTPGGNKKKKDIEIPLKTREVSISYIEKLNREDK